MLPEFRLLRVSRPVFEEHVEDLSKRHVPPSIYFSCFLTFVILILTFMSEMKYQRTWYRNESMAVFVENPERLTNLFLNITVMYLPAKHDA